MDVPTNNALHSASGVVLMEPICIGLVIVGLLTFVHSLRLRGCLSFGVWVLAGMAVMGLLLWYVLSWPHF